MPQLVIRDIAQPTYEGIFRDELDAAISRFLKRIDPDVDGDLAGQIFDGSIILGGMKRDIAERAAELGVDYWEAKGAAT